MNADFKIDEKDVSQAIISEYLKELYDCTDCDVIVAGSGPAGTIAAWKLAEMGYKTVIMEKNIKPGGGMYLGGMLMNKLVVEETAMHLLEEAGVRSMKAYKNGLLVGDAYEVSTKLLAKAFDAGAKMLNAVEVVDVIYREKEGIKGVVANWHAVSEYPEWVTCVDPLAFRSKIVIDATGHATEIASVAGDKIGFPVKGREGSMWTERSEKETVEYTQELYPGLIVCGMAVNSTYGLPRMGPIFGAMFLSGEKAAKIAHERLTQTETIKAKN
ncbi:MAG: thiazole biosynthesis protein [Candidatus Diapherotrites archaeon]|nr:thiazole biosynthesis protein [Candidatus Diapherotrites archaeon]